jgi:preprotein translocase subunit SecE
MWRADITSAWICRSLSEARKVENPTLRQAVNKSREVAENSGFLAGQILAADGLVLAKFVADTIRFNAKPRL